MIRAPFAATAALSLGLFSGMSGSMVAFPAPLAAQEQPQVANLTAQDDQQRYSEKQLDNLVSPIALYPDPLLAQLLIAATFPDQVEDAAAWVRANGTNNVDEQSWDVSVKSVAHYPSALNMMADKPDWMATLGRAYAFQSGDVMLAVQRMRALAASHGNLVSNQQQQVVREDDNYVIIPAQPRVIYVPVYDPLVIYTRPVFGFALSSRYWSWGVGFPIGGWLPYDCDWGRRVVYYNGWNYQYLAWGGGWRARSRPFIHITNVYVNPIYQTVLVGRSPYHRRIDYNQVDRWGRVHRDVYFGNRRGEYGDRDGWVRDNDRNRDRTATPRDRAVATPDGYTRGGATNRDATRSGPRDATRDGRANNTQVTGVGDDNSRVGGSPINGNPVVGNPIGVNPTGRNPVSVDRGAVGRGGIGRVGVEKGDVGGNGVVDRGGSRAPVSIGDVRGRGDIENVRDRGRTDRSGDRSAVSRPVPIGTIQRAPQREPQTRSAPQRAPETRSTPQRAPQTRSAPTRAPETRSAPQRSGGSQGSAGVQRGSSGTQRGAVRRGN